MSEDSSKLEAIALRSLRRWGKLWGVPNLASRVSVAFSRRLSRSLGRCNLTTGRIRITARLKGADPDLVQLILCHEAAHAATFLRFGPGRRPHGPEWAAMVTAAGYPPSRKLGLDSLKPLTQCSRTAALFKHICPVCQHVRYARRAVPRWRCAACVESGLDGRLVIERRELQAQDTGA